MKNRYERLVIFLVFYLMVKEKELMENRAMDEISLIVEALKKIENIKEWSEQHGLNYYHVHQIKNGYRKRLHHETVKKMMTALGIDAATGQKKPQRLVTFVVEKKSKRELKAPVLLLEGKERSQGGVVSVEVPDRLRVSEEEALMVLVARKVKGRAGVSQEQADGIEAFMDGNYAKVIEIAAQLLQKK
jgi:hypothetical protein